MSQKIVLEVDVKSKDAAAKVDSLGANVKKANKEVKETGAELDGLTSKLDKVSGGAIGAFKNLSSGAQAGIKAMQGLRLAIAATGIGLLVVTILAVKAAFEGSEEGQNKFAKIMGVINAVVGNFVDILANVGELIIGVFENPKAAMQDFGNLIKEQIINRFTGMLELIPNLAKAVKQLFEGDFSGAAETAANAIGKVALGIEDTVGAINAATEATKEFIEEQIREGKLAAEVADKRAKADLMERDLLVERAKLESNIAQLKLKSRQEDEFTAEQRRGFIVEAQKLEESLLEKQTEVLELRRDAIQIENQFARSNKQNLDDQAKAEAEVLKQQAARLDGQRATQRELNRLTKEAGAAAAAASKEQIEAIEAISAALRTQSEQEVFAVNEKYGKLIEQAKKFGGDVQALEAARLDAIEEISQKELDAERKKQGLISAEQERFEVERANARQRIAEAFMGSDELELENERKKYDSLIAEAVKFGEDISALEEQKEQRISDIRMRQAHDRLAVEEDLAKAEMDAKINMAGQLTGALAGALGEQTEAGKAAAVVGATISTYAGAAKSIQIYGPTPLGFAGVATALLAGFTQVKNILSIKNPFGGGGGGSVSGGGGAPPPTANTIGLISPNQQAQQFGDSAGEALQGSPIKAYVLQEDVKSGADYDNKIRANAGFE